MSAQNEATVRRFYEEMCNGRRNDLAPELFSAGDRVVVRWTPATGNAVHVDAITIHRTEDGKIAETWETWDTLGLLQQIGAVRSA
jgi:ketosteroid isomerase-like protein